MLKYWFTAFILITFFYGLTYAAIQHVLRMDANDPQIQIAEDTADRLANGLPAQSALNPTKIDISKSLASFVIIYASNGQPVASSGRLNGQIPWLPNGVLQSAKQNGEDRVTWQPQPGTRIAAIIVPYSGNNEGYILAGRSLREVEKREDDLVTEIAVAWLASLFVATFSFYLPFLLKQKKKPTKKKK